MIVLLIVGIIVMVVGVAWGMGRDEDWGYGVAIGSFVVGLIMVICAAITLAGQEDEACRKSGGTMQETGHIIMIPIVISTGKTTTVVMSPVPETKCVHQEVQG